MGVPPSGAPVAAAVVTAGETRVLVGRSQKCTFGRGDENDLRIGQADVQLSRKAGSIVGVSDGALIRNLSRTQSIRYQALGGPEMWMAPGMVVGTMPFELVRLELFGKYGAVYAVEIDARGLLGGRRGRPVRSGLEPIGEEPPTLRQSTDGLTVYKPSRVPTGRELVYLAALCEPILTQPGGRPRSYRQIAERAGAKNPDTVRTTLDRLRNRLSNEGIPGLRSMDEAPRNEDSTYYVEALARWAIDSRTVDEERVFELFGPPA